MTSASVQFDRERVGVRSSSKTKKKSLAIAGPIHGNFIGWSMHLVTDGLRTWTEVRAGLSCGLTPDNTG